MDSRSRPVRGSSSVGRLSSGILMAEKVESGCKTKRKELSQRERYKLALLIAWLGASVVMLLCLVAPLVVADDWILDNAPTCWRQAQYGESCSICGMTRAFVLISGGELARARVTNSLSIPVWAVFLINSVLFLLFVAARVAWRAERWRYNSPGLAS